jgi:hypothetical protein
VEPEYPSVSDRYRKQAEVVFRLAARAESPAEKDLYLSIADGWRKLAAQALRHELAESGHVAAEPRSFSEDDDEKPRWGN